MPMNKDPFKEYIINAEPDKSRKGYAWSTAIGLQAVDGLKPSQYLIDKAIQNIEGDLSMEEVRSLVDSYYNEKPTSDDSDRTEEADKVSQRIAELLSEQAFSFSPTEYISIHRKLFTGIYSHAGKIRDYNITKKEWVLDGETVIYGSATELRATLEYDLEQERKFRYDGLSIDEIIKHLAVFISRLWQIHIFGEGNTRTTAVFFIKYLRMLGFNATNDIFAENAWYFRNAMVRANYNNLQKGIHETTEYLELFLRNLLLNENNELQNRQMHVSGKLKAMHQDEKVDIQSQKVDIDTKKVDIESILESNNIHFSTSTVTHIHRMFNEFGPLGVFGRSDVKRITGLKDSGASKFLKNILEAEIIEPVSGHGKGKYRFLIFN